MFRSLELPASAKRLDNVLHLRSPKGQEYMHVLEWQGYPDPVVLWRMLGYMGWLGQRLPKMTVLGTLVYLTPDSDAGDTLHQMIDGQSIRPFQLSVTTSCGKLPAHQNAMAEGLKNDACSRIMGDEFAAPNEGASDAVQPRPDCTADAV